MNLKFLSLLLAAHLCTAISPNKEIVPTRPVLPASAAEAPAVSTEISPALLTEFRRHVLFSGASSCDDLLDWDCTACKASLVKSTVVHRQLKNTLTATHGYVAVNHDIGAVVIAFRGSGDTFAWMQDALVIRRRFDVVGNGATVHSGFYNAWKAAKDGVAESVSQLLAQYAGYTINVTGHSLGAAVASMIAVQLARQYPSVTVNLFGISEPRVGNAAYATALEEQTNLNAYRLEQANDFVGNFPKRWLGYVHHGTEYWIKEAFTDKIIRCENVPGDESSLCANSVKSKFSSDVHNHVLGYNFAAGCDTSGSNSAARKT